MTEPEGMVGRWSRGRLRSKFSSGLHLLLAPWSLGKMARAPQSIERLLCTNAAVTSDCSSLTGAVGALPLPCVCTRSQGSAHCCCLFSSVSHNGGDSARTCPWFTLWHSYPVTSTQGPSTSWRVCCLPGFAGPQLMSK